MPQSKRAVKDRCDDCGSILVRGECPTFDEHDIQMETVASLQERLLRAERRRSEINLAMRSLRTTLDDREKAIELLNAKLGLYEREWNEKPQWLSKQKKDTKHHGTLLAILSDTHYGEMVNPNEMGGSNAYNLEIAKLRTIRFFDKTMMVARNYITGLEFDGIVLALGGDLVSGDIHDELVETNELSTYDTVVATLPWLKHGIEKWAEEFGKVHVVSAPGNHGRNSKKPRHKGRSANNADTHIARLLAMMFENEKDITFDIPESSDVDFKIYNSRFVLEHGDSLKSTTGSVIGALGPAKRGTIQKKQSRAQEGRPFDFLALCHFHQLVLAHTQGFIMNGSLKGFDEYAKNLMLTPEPPQQALLTVTPENGITGSYPILVSKRDEEGW